MMQRLEEKNVRDFSMELIWTKVQMAATFVGGW